MEEEGIEQQILLQPEFAIVGAVYSVNGYTGHVILKTSDLENDSGYQTGTDVQSSISSHNESEEAHPYLQGLIGEKQDQLTAGTNISIDNNVISATDTRYSAGNGLNLSSENAFSIDTTVVATQQNLANEVTNRENADNALQAQIDGISASSDVVDIVGTYAELQQYDTQHLKDNDIIKVLQDETQGGATTYYRWSTTTSTFTLIGQEGPYYTKAAADSQFVPQTRTVNGKALSSNITLNASDVSALGTSDVVQTTGTSTSQVMSQNAVTTQLNTKLNASDYVVDTQLADSSNPVQNRVINNLLGDMPTDFFTAGETVSGEGTNITLNNTIAAPIDDVELKGDTFQQTYSGKNIIDNTDLTFDHSNVPSSYTTLTTLPTGIRYKTTYSSAGSPLLTFKLPVDLSQYVGKTVRIKANFGAKGEIRITRVNDTLTARTPIISTHISGETISWTVTNDLGDVKWLAYSLAIAEPGGEVTVDFTDLIMTIDNSDMSYEPYTGGIASPNPDFPQDVQVVTGEQTVEATGKNLIGLTDVAVTSALGLTYQVIGGRLILNGTTTSAGRISVPLTKQLTATNGQYYSLSANVTGSYTGANFDVQLRDDTNAATVYTVKNTALPSTANTITGQVGYFALYIGSNRTFNNYGIAPQFEQNSTATTYQPYQSQSYTVNLTSKNLNGGYPSSYSATNGDVAFVSNTDGTISANGTSSSGNAYSMFVANATASGWVRTYEPGTYTLSGGDSNVDIYFQTTDGSTAYNTSAQESVTFTLTESHTAYIRMGVRTGNTVNKTYKIQLEKSSTPSTYRPYYVYELCKIGTYQDYIYKSGDDWYVHKATGKSMLGSLTWTAANTGDSNYKKMGTSGLSGLYVPPSASTDTIIAYCSHFTPRTEQNLNNRIVGLSGRTSGVNIYVYDTDYNTSSSASDFKTWLTDNSVSLYYALVTPTDTKITDSTLISELEALWGARSYLDTTHFITSATGTNLPVILDVDAYRKSLAGTLGAIERLSE